MEEFDGKTFSQNGKQRKHIFPNRENGENHFLIKFEMFLNSIWIKRKNYNKRGKMEEFEKKKKPGQLENRENSCSQVCKEEINILI